MLCYNLPVCAFLGNELAWYVQFEEGEVGIAVICLVLALLGNIFLEGGGGLWVVAVEAVQDGIDVLGPVRAVVEGDAHGQGNCVW